MKAQMTNRVTLRRASDPAERYETTEPEMIRTWEMFYNGDPDWTLSTERILLVAPGKGKTR
jgi:hypothetical protein